MPGQFIYFLYEDTAVTGRLEVTIFKNETDCGYTGTGELVHSKHQSKQYIAQNVPAFLENVKAAIP